MTNEGQPQRRRIEGMIKSWCWKDVCFGRNVGILETNAFPRRRNSISKDFVDIIIFTTEGDTLHTITSLN